MNFPAQLNMAVLLRQLLIAAVSGSILIMPASAEMDATVPSATAASLSTRLDRSRLYLGETTTITVTLQRGKTAVRNIRYPVVLASGVTIGEFAPPRHQEIQKAGMEVVSDEFTATVTPQKPGVTKVGPVRIDLEQLEPAGGAASFFGETTSTPISLLSDPLELTVLPLPTAGRPADFSGAVGRFTFEVSAKPTDVRIGNPVTVSSIISGVGNLAFVKCPKLTSPGIKAYPPQTMFLSDAMQCEQVIVPITIGMKTLPQSRFTFFDPVTTCYRTLLSETIPLTIIDENNKNVESGVPIVPKTVPVVRQHFWSSSWSPFYIGVITIAISVILVSSWCSKQVASQQNPNASARLPFLLETARHALSNNDVELFYITVFRATEQMVAYIPSCYIQEDKMKLIENINGKYALNSFKNITSLNELVACCNAVRYGCYKPTCEDMREHLNCFEYLCKSNQDFSY